jgi:hypothetical protein
LLLSAKADWTRLLISPPPTVATPAANIPFLRKDRRFERFWFGVSGCFMEFSLAFERMKRVGIGTAALGVAPAEVAPPGGITSLLRDANYRGLRLLVSAGGEMKVVIVTAGVDNAELCR